MNLTGLFFGYQSKQELNEMKLASRDKWIDVRVRELVVSGLDRREASKQALKEKRWGDARIARWRELKIG